MKSIIITTTPSIEGHPIREYLGLVSTQTAIMIANIDLKKPKMLEEYRSLILATENALRKEAEVKGGNAVVSVNFGTELRGMGRYIFAFGTAVIVE